MDTEKYLHPWKGINPILAFCSEEPKSLAKICKELHIKRSTLAYYLNILEKKRAIKKHRVKKGQTGSPTLIFYVDRWKKHRDKITNPLQKKVLKLFIKNNKKMTFDEINDAILPKNYTEEEQTIFSDEFCNYIESLLTKFYYINPKLARKQLKTIE